MCVQRQLVRAAGGHHADDGVILKHRQRPRFVVATCSKNLVFQLSCRSSHSVQETETLSTKKISANSIAPK